MDHQRKNIALLGSTGSIGRNALDVIARFPDRFRVTALTANRNIGLLQEQVQRFRPHSVVIQEERNAVKLRKALDGSTEVLVGEGGIREVVTRSTIDLVLTALVGFAGLKPTFWAIEAGKDIALANKETLVVGGKLIMGRAKEKGIQLLPVDSEHSAILQCLRGENLKAVERLILTASGGPFLHLQGSSLSHVTRAQALNHPTWSMGKKITIDSATLMNKGLEVIEAHWLFGLPADKIDVVIHPQSIIHSMVEFTDGSIKAQLGIPDMKIPIQYALAYPERPSAPYPRVNFATLRQMTFYEPDVAKFRCLPLAYRALRMGGTAPAVLNAANEAAVDLFLEDRILFSSIPDIIEQALDAHSPLQDPSLDDLVRIDHETREGVLHLHSQTV